MSGRRFKTSLIRADAAGATASPAGRRANPFYPGLRRYRDARHEFEFLRDLTEADLPEVCRNTPRFAELETSTRFISSGSPNTIQFGFGSRPMGRDKIDGSGTAVEEGGTVVYSLGPTGELAIVLYPRKSDLGGAKEDHLFLSIGSFSARNTHGRLPRIVRLLIQYVTVTSLDCSPTWRDQAKIAWLRLWLHGQWGGKFVKSAASGGTVALAGKSASTTFAKLMALLVIAGLAVLLSRLGLPAVAQIIHPSSSEVRVKCVGGKVAADGHMQRALTARRTGKRRQDAAATANSNRSSRTLD